MYGVGEKLISTTMSWLNWMPHLRSLRIDTQMLLKFVSTISLNDTIDRFSSLEKLIVYQLDNAPDDDTLTVIARFAVPSSLQNICVEQYKMLNSQSMNDNNFLLPIRQICCNMHNLETMTIEFTSPHSLFDSKMLDELAVTEKKIFQFECIYVSDNFVQFCLEK